MLVRNRGEEHFRLLVPTSDLVLTLIDAPTYIVMRFALSFTPLAVLCVASNVSYMTTTYHETRVRSNRDAPYFLAKLIGTARTKILKDSEAGR